MADIRAFRAVRYAPDQVGDLSDVVTPPYDVIDAQAQEEFYLRHPKNFVRVDLPKPLPADGEGNDRYTRAAATYRAWLDEGVLQKDEEPGFYIYEQTFDADGRTVVRKGFLGVVRLHAYEDRVILPHERTLKGPKEDRMNLMVATEAQLSQLFLLYDDPERAVDAKLAEARAAEPEVDITTPDGIRHCLWTVNDPDAIAFVSKRLASEKLLIADGHHRYETALAYRNRRRKESGAEGEQPWDFALAYLANAADPGLIVWPTHRAIHSLDDFDVDSWLERVAPYFHVEALDPELTPKTIEVLLARSGEQAPSFVVLAPGDDAKTRPTLLRLDAEAAAEHLAKIPGPDAARTLDVNVLHDFVLPDLTGISLEAQAAKTNVHYIKGLEAAFEAAADGEHQMVLLMNPLPVPKVRAVCESGGFMPQKSTYFYPKVLSGLLINDVRRA